MKNIRILALVTLLLAACPIFSQNTQSSTAGTISVKGEAELSLPADYAMVQITVSHESGNAKEAHGQVTEEMGKVLEFLKKQEGIADVRTTRVNLRPRNIGPRGETSGYYANQTLHFRLNKLENYDDLMLQLIAMGVNGIDNVSFQSSQADEVEQTLLKQAMQDAREKAELMAGQYGQNVGKATYISDNINSGGPRPMFEYKSANLAVSGPSVEPGEITVSTSVSVEFELK